MASVSHLPPEIIQKIFREYLKTETQYDFINCVSKVCRNWEEMCKDHFLWHEFDGTLPFELLKDYCNQGILKNCKKLIFSKIENFPTAKEMEEVYENLPHLNCVNFSNVMGMRSKHFFGELVSKCPELQEIVFNDKLHNYIISPGIVGFPIHGCSLFKNFLKVRGTDLVSLVFANLYLTASIDLFWMFSESCPNLEILRIENVDHDNTISFPTVQMQKMCPKMRILSLGYPVIITNQEPVSGFKNLEIFRNPSQLNYLFPKCAIDAIIFGSQKLKELDISRCVFVKGDCLHPVNYSHVENLNISFGIVYDLSCFIEVLQKWSHSLKVLDISNMTDVSLNDMFQTIISNGGLQNLTLLNLNGTPVSTPTVKLIVQNCPQLCVLNLELCSELEEFSSKYEGETAIKMLHSRLISLDYT